MQQSVIYQEWKEEFLQEGREEGRQEGRQEGKLEEAQSMILRLLARPIGDVSPEMQIADPIAVLRSDLKCSR